MLGTVIAELAVHLVGKQEQVIFLHQCAHCHQILFRIEISGGVIGVAYHDGACSRRNHLLELLHMGQCKSRLNVARYRHYLRIAQFGKGVVVGVIRFGDDNLVARIQTHREGHLQRLATAGGHQYALRRDVDIVAFIVFAQLVSVTLYTGAGTVSKHLYLGLSQCLQGSLGSLNIGLANIQVIHMYSVSLGCICKGHQFADCRLGQLISFFRYGRHNNNL